MLHHVVFYPKVGPNGGSSLLYGRGPLDHGILCIPLPLKWSRDWSLFPSQDIPRTCCWWTPIVALVGIRTRSDTEQFEGFGNKNRTGDRRWQEGAEKEEVHGRTTRMARFSSRMQSAGQGLIEFWNPETPKPRTDVLRPLGAFGLIFLDDPYYLAMISQMSSGGLQWMLAARWVSLQFPVKHWAKEGHSTSFYGSTVAHRSSISNGSNVSNGPRFSEKNISKHQWHQSTILTGRRWRVHLRFQGSTHWSCVGHGSPGWFRSSRIPTWLSPQRAWQLNCWSVWPNLNWRRFEGIWERFTGSCLLDSFGHCDPGISLESLHCESLKYNFRNSCFDFLKKCFTLSRSVSSGRSQPDFLIASLGVLDSCCPLRCFKQFDHPAALATCDVARFFVNLEEGQRLSFWNFVSPQWIGIAQDFCRRRHTLNANQQCRICIYCIYVIKCYIYIQLYTYILFNWDIYYDNILWYTHIDII